MLEPPPEGTFDIEDESLPVKNPPNDGLPEQVPLLTQEDVPTNQSSLKQGKVKTNLSFLCAYTFNIICCIPMHTQPLKLFQCRRGQLKCPLLES